MKIFRVVKRIFFYISLTLFVLVAAGVISSIIYKDRIIQQLVREANKYINTPIQVAKIDLNLFDRFPLMAISFDQVIVQESWPHSSDPLLRAEKAYVILNPLDMLRGEMVVNQIHIEGGTFFIKVDAKGIHNYNIVSAKNDSTISPVKLDLNNVDLKDVTVYYTDARSNQEHKFYSVHQKASLSVHNKLYSIRSSGDITCHYINAGGKTIFSEKDLIVDANFIFDPTEQKISFNPSTIQLDNSKFEVTGDIETSGTRQLDLYVEGVDTNIQTLLSLLPAEKIEKFRQYESRGDVYFSADFSGKLGTAISTAGTFGLNNASITYPGSKTQVNDLGVKGLIESSDISNPEKGLLQLEDIRGTIGDRSFYGNLTVNNFKDPMLVLDWKGEMDVSELLNLFPSDRIATAAGILSGNFHFDGRFDDLKSRFTVEKTTASGMILLQGVELTFKGGYPPAIHCAGTLEFANPDLAIKHISVRIGNSYFDLKGSFMNILPFLLLPKQKIRIKATINDAFVDMDELLATDGQSSEEPSKYLISENLELDLQCNINKLHYKKFVGAHFSGGIKVKDSKAFVQNMRFHSMGGQLGFNGLVNTQNGYIQISNSAELANIQIDSVFYVFNNFGQDWLVKEHLKGRVYADVLTDLSLGPDLKFDTNSLIADISISIRDGELNDFQPMMDLEKYVSDDNLRNLRFSDLQNDIHVENRIIYVPNMEVRSNVSNIQISGTHNFDQHIDYHVVVPLKALTRNRNDDMFGAVEETESGSKLHLKIVGTTDNYEIIYDTKAVGQKIVADLKKEVQELKDAFKKKESTEEEILLNEDEFFEWDEEDTTGYYQYTPGHFK